MREKRKGETALSLFFGRLLGLQGMNHDRLAGSVLCLRPSPIGPCSGETETFFFFLLQLSAASPHARRLWVFEPDRGQS